MCFRTVGLWQEYICYGMGFVVHAPKSKTGTKETWAVVAHGFESNHRSSLLKGQIPKTIGIWNSTMLLRKQTRKRSCDLSTWHVCVVFPQACAAVLGRISRWGGAEQGWQAGTVIPLQTALPQGPQSEFGKKLFILLLYYLYINCIFYITKCPGTALGGWWIPGC